MESDPKSGKVTATLQEIAFYNMFLTEAIFEALAEKGVLSREDVTQRIQRLKSETRLIIGPVH